MGTTERLIVCCPHLADKGAPDTLVVEGGPLTLSPPVTILRRMLGLLAYTQEAALQELRIRMNEPGLGEISLLAHQDCECEFLAPLDAQDTNEELLLLAHELQEGLCRCRRLRVMVEVLELADPTAAGRQRRQSGERLISPAGLDTLHALAGRRSA